MKKIIIASITLLMTACSANFTKTGENSFAPLAQGCNFSIYTTSPKKEFEEIGLVEFIPDFLGAFPRSLSSAKEKAAPLVCQNGGNGLLVWESNGLGQYLKATIIRFTEAG